MKERVEKTCSSSTKPNTCIATIFVSLKNLGNEFYKMWKASKMCQSQGFRRSIWNGASITTLTPDFIVISNTFDYNLWMDVS
jgi:hypothetical protein